jgi:hypothetical protein
MFRPTKRSTACSISSIASGLEARVRRASVPPWHPTTSPALWQFAIWRFSIPRASRRRSLSLLPRFAPQDPGLSRAGESSGGVAHLRVSVGGDRVPMVRAVLKTPARPAHTGRGAGPQGLARAVHQGSAELPSDEGAGPGSGARGGRAARGLRVVMVSTALAPFRCSCELSPRPHPSGRGSLTSDPPSGCPACGARPPRLGV